MKKILFGPVLGIIAYLLIHPTDHQVALMCGILVWMAYWWVSEAIPMGVTALLPLVLFPLTGLMNATETAPLYMHHIMFLFIGGFLLAFALEKWNLHRRIALKLILWAGTTPSRMLLGFMASGYFLSMWISNTATVLMLMPATLAIAEQLKKGLPKEKQRHFKMALLMGIAYGAAIGGTATLVGTPPNLIMKGLYEAHVPGAQIGFLTWFLFAFPISFCFFVVGYLVLSIRYCRFQCKVSAEYIREKYDELGKPGPEEKAVGIVFGITVLLWFFRQDIDLSAVVIPGWARLFPRPELIKDSTVAMIAGLVLFTIPSKSRSGYVLELKELQKIPFDLLFLMGGGIVIARGFEVSGLSHFLEDQMLPVLASWHPLFVILVATVFVVFITEVASNSPSISLVVPVIFSVCAITGIPHLTILAPVTIGASYAFMLPVATPPNAIVYSSGDLPLSVLIRNGIWFNLIGIALVMGGVMLLGSWLG